MSKYIWPILAGIGFVANYFAAHVWHDLFRFTGTEGSFMLWKFYGAFAVICFVALIVTTFGVLSGKIKY